MKIFISRSFLGTEYDSVYQTVLSYHNFKKFVIKVAKRAILVFWYFSIII